MTGNACVDAFAVIRPVTPSTVPMAVPADRRQLLWEGDGSLLNLALLANRRPLRQMNDP